MKHRPLLSIIQFALSTGFIDCLQHDRNSRVAIECLAPILWQYGVLARLKDGEIIDELLYNNYSTISLGYAGIAEMTYRMTGCSHMIQKMK